MTRTTTTGSIDRSATVAQIVAQRSETAAIFRRHRIDFCCHGDVTVVQACGGKERAAEELFAELEQAVRERTGEPVEEDLLTLSTPALLARIVDRHHAYLRHALPRVAPLLAKVVAVHGAHNPRLAGVRDVFTELTEALEPHLDFEEEVLFPELVRPGGPAASARAHLDEMVKEHLGVGAQLARLRALTDDFTTPLWGCGSYRALLAELEELEADLLLHVNIENHVLMPRFTKHERIPVRLT